MESVMRHFLRSIVGPLPLPRRVLTRADRRTLILGACSAHRLPPANRTAVAGTVNLPVVALGAHARRNVAACTLELPNLTDHPDPGRGRFLDAGAEMSDGPPRNVASITAMTRKARGANPRAFAMSAAPATYPTARLAPRNGPWHSDRSRLSV